MPENPGNKANPEKRVAVYTLGCKVNQAESREIVEAFRQRGWREAAFDGRVSVYVVNTCTVTGAADQKSRKIIRGVKTRNPEALLAVTGCYAESGREALEEIAEVDLLLGNGQKETLAETVEKVWLQRNARGGAGQAGEGAENGKAAENAQGVAQRVAAGDTAKKTSKKTSKKTAESIQRDAPESAAGNMSENVPVRGTERTRAALKLQDGCRQFCSYCIIPYVRRNLYSMPEAEALRRAAALAAAGYREVVLLGIHLGAYGRETGEKDGLARVFGALLEAFPRIRFRLGSLEPPEATEGLVSLIRDYPNACKHLHLPLQSGSDAVLRAMNRPYRTADYRGIAGRIRREIPDIALTTDIMTGFPGEGAAEHGQSLAFAREMAFSRMHVFVYSRRPGTPAADMSGQVKNTEKNSRSAELLRLEEQMRTRYAQSWTGRVQEVLLEEELPGTGGSWIGHGDNYMEVIFTPETVPRAAAENGGGCLAGIAGVPETQTSEGTEVCGEKGWKGKILPLFILGRSAFKPGAWQGRLSPEKLNAELSDMPGLRAALI